MSGGTLMVAGVPYDMPRPALAAGVVDAWCQCTCGSGGGSIGGARLCVSPNVVPRAVFFAEADRCVEVELTPFPASPCLS